MTPLTPCRQDKYIPPKRPYSFEALLCDILAFAANMLVEDGRLGMWMPTANEEEVELVVPEHAALEVVSMCVQPFNKCESFLFLHLIHVSVCFFLHPDWKELIKRAYKDP